MWDKVLLIGVGSGLGGISRYGLSNAVYALIGKWFPYGTLVVNVLGCFLMGLLFVFILERAGEYGDSLRALLLIGFLGGFTTFSSFSLETMNLIESGAVLRAIINIGLSVAFCLLATAIGMAFGRQI